MMDKKGLQLDETDQQIIKILSANSRKSGREIANELNLSHQTVVSRIKDLENKKVIRGYTSILDWKKIGYGVNMGIFVEFGKLLEGDLDKIREYVAKEPSFAFGCTLTGKYDIFLIGLFKTTEEADEKTTKLRHFLSHNTDLHRFRADTMTQLLKHSQF